MSSLTKIEERYEELLKEQKKIEKMKKNKET